MRGDRSLYDKLLRTAAELRSLYFTRAFESATVDELERWRLVALSVQLEVDHLDLQNEEELRSRIQELMARLQTETQT